MPRPTFGDLIWTARCSLNQKPFAPSAAKWSLNAAKKIPAGMHAAHATVMNGASDLMVEAFGDAGLHARTTIGARALPSGIAVEIEGLFELG